MLPCSELAYGPSRRCAALHECLQLMNCDHANLCLRLWQTQPHLAETACTAAVRATGKAGNVGSPALRVTLEPCSHLSAVTLLRAAAGSERASQANFSDLLVCDSLCLHCEVCSIFAAARRRVAQRLCLMPAATTTHAPGAAEMLAQ